MSLATMVWVQDLSPPIFGVNTSATEACLVDLFQYYYSGSHWARQSYCIAPWSDRTQGPADSSADTGWVPLLPGKKCGA